MNLLVCLLVIIITGTLVIKKFKAQTVLLLGGLIMMFAAYLLGYTTSFVDAKKAAYWSTPHWRWGRPCRRAT